MNGWGRAWIVAAALLFTVAACGGDSSELTTVQMLQKLEGRPMSQAEIDDRLALADLLCGFENRVLVQVWGRLNPEELEFQDWVFGEHCPERLTAYADARPNTGTAPVSPTTTTTVLPIDPSIVEGIERSPVTFPEIDLN